MLFITVVARFVVFVTAAPSDLNVLVHIYLSVVAYYTKGTDVFKFSVSAVVTRVSIDLCSFWRHLMLNPYR